MLPALLLAFVVAVKVFKKTTPNGEPEALDAQLLCGSRTPLQGLLAGESRSARLIGNKRGCLLLSCGLSYGNRATFSHYGKPRGAFSSNSQKIDIYYPQLLLVSTRLPEAKPGRIQLRNSGNPPYISEVRMFDAQRNLWFSG